MNSKILNISFCIIIFVAWMSSPVFAQVGSPQASSSPQGFGVPQSSVPLGSQAPNSYQGGTPFNQSSPVPQQGAASTQGIDVSQTSKDLQGSTQQPNTQSMTSTQASNVPQTKEASPRSDIPSSIEVAFREMSPTRTPAGTGAGASLGILRQFGYSIFARPVSTFAPVEDVPIGPDYVLGPGDELRITVWGAMENTYVQTVDRYGRIYLPTIGPVRVWGLTFTQAEKLILAHLSQYYKGFQSSVTMGHLRTIKVYIVGEVNQPGAYNISALSTLSNALFAAGGPSSMGSLRKIELKRDHHTAEPFDFYDFLLHGEKRRDFRLESGDVIFIPPIGPVVGIMGQIKRPAIYELKEPIHVRELIDMAGGLTPQSYLKRVQVIRPKPNTEREVIDLNLTEIGGNEDTPKGKNDIELQNGDLVTIYATDPRIYNTVTLSGIAKHPGEYELKPGMKLSQMLSPGSLLPNAYLDNVEVVRFKDDLTTEVIRVNLKKVWSGDPIQDITLKPRDQITVRTEFKGSETVILNGEFKLPGAYTVQPGDRLSSVIKRAGGFTDKAYLKGTIFTRTSVAMKEKEKLDEFMRQYEENVLSKGKFFIGDEGKAINQLEVAQTREQLKLIASKVTLGRIVIHLDDLEKFEGTADDVILQDGDTLMVPQKPSEVAVLGSVRNPTSFIHKKDENIEYYINRSGGLVKTADKKEIYMLKADGSATVGFLKLKNIDPGDVIVVPPKKVKLHSLAWAKDVATIAGQSALSIAALSLIAK